MEDSNKGTYHINSGLIYETTSWNLWSTLLEDLSDMQNELNHRKGLQLKCAGRLSDSVYSDVPEAVR